MWFIPPHSSQMYGASATLGIGGSTLLVTVLTMLAQDLIGDNVVRKLPAWRSRGKSGRANSHGLFEGTHKILDCIFLQNCYQCKFVLTWFKHCRQRKIFLGRSCVFSAHRKATICQCSCLQLLLTIFYVVKIANSRFPLIAKWLPFFQNLYYDSLVTLSQKIPAASLL